jgi:hypothetical protein
LYDKGEWAMSERSAQTAAPADNGELFSIEEVLAAEAKEIHGNTEEIRKLGTQAEKQPVQDARKNLNADDRGEEDVKRESAKVQARGVFYVGLNSLNRAALCCSGGGIRSATFCLGVIQAFANYDVDAGVLRGKAAAIARSNASTPNAHPAEAEQARQADVVGASKPEVYTPIDPKVSALGRFHYLSTVSGGGYIGSWLSSWRSRSDFSTVINDLTSRPKGADIEPPEISWLRAYSNYLTPQLGVTSADGWAAFAILIRNLVLNWLVIIPIVCLVLLLLKLTATVSVWFAHTMLNACIVWFVGFGALFLIVGQSFTNRYRPPRRIGDVNPAQGAYLGRAFIWAFLSAMFLTIFFSSRWFLEDFEKHVALIGNELCLTPFLDWLHLDLKLKFIFLSAIVAALIYTLGWIAAFRFQNGWSDFFRWAASGLVYGALVALGVYLFWQLGPYPATLKNVKCLLLSVILGVPWILMAQLVSEIIFVGLASDEVKADADREWLGRAAGWLAVGAATWAILAFLVFAGGYLVENAVELGHQTLVKAGGIAGVISAIVTAVLGGSGKTPAKSSSDEQGSVTAIVCNIALGLAGPLFVAVLIIVLSAALDKLLIGGALADKMQLIDVADPSSTSSILWWLSIGLAIAGLIGFLASYFVNINRFSLHALYRNRLTRCYLGASNDERKPDKFSGFDFDDNLCVHKIWPPKSDKKLNPSSLFHVVNIALNIVSTKRLAWQERKAESFTASPLHCGAAYLGFRKSNKYGGISKDGNLDKSGLSLGTAMAISGAAVSPNMGYHSSPSIALLLTLFNVRLGWWLGNPGKAGDKTYADEGPKWAALPLFSEAFGRTTDNNGYVYLSDGGHFENLGLYEMVRRRCRLIVVIDAGCDPDFSFEDLGNAVRKIYIDLGIRITFADLGSLVDRPSGKLLSRAKRDAAALATIHAADRLGKKTEEVAEGQRKAEGKGSKIAAPGEPPYHAIGVIHYREADHPVDGSHVENGHILYIKPAYHGSEKNAGIRSYAMANPEFPHETTADQWFTESQLESYRCLGLEIAAHILNHEVVLRPANPQIGVTTLTLHDALQGITVQNLP